MYKLTGPYKKLKEAGWLNDEELVAAVGTKAAALIKENLERAEKEPVEIEFQIAESTLYPAWNGKLVTLLIEMAWDEKLEAGDFRPKS
jgi:hypothetical protein